MNDPAMTCCGRTASIGSSWLLFKSLHVQLFKRCIIVLIVVMIISISILKRVPFGFPVQMCSANLPSAVGKQPCCKKTAALLFANSERMRRDW